MQSRASAFTVLLACACNEVLGITPGRPMPDAGEARTDSRGGSGNGQDGDASTCSTSNDCIEQGLAWPPHLCLAGACVDIFSEDCDTLVGTEWLADHPEDEPIVFGVLGRYTEAGGNLELAMTEFNEHGPVPIDGVPRRPALLFCRVDHDPLSIAMRRSLDHLLDIIRVPGVMMIQSPSELAASMRYAVGEKRAQVLFIDVGGGNSELSARALDEGRLWHMTGDASPITKLFRPLVRSVEEHVNPGASSGNGARLTRVMLVLPRKQDGFESVMAEGIEASVLTNGRLMASDPDTYRTVIPTDYADVGSTVITLEPDIVIDFGGVHDFIDDLVRRNGGTPPFYILPPSQAHSPYLRDRAATDRTLHARVVGVNHAVPDKAHQPLYDAYIERLRTRAPAFADARGPNVYEAAYFLTYAAVAGGTGAGEMNEGMTRLSSLDTNLRRDIGPTSIDSVIELLRSAPSLSLHGALGPPNFDPNDGRRPMPASVWCIDQNQEFRMNALTVVHDEFGVAKLVGTFPCFDFSVTPALSK